MSCRRSKQVCVCVYVFYRSFGCDVHCLPSRTCATCGSRCLDSCPFHLVHVFFYSVGDMNAIEGDPLRLHELNLIFALDPCRGFIFSSVHRREYVLCPTTSPLFVFFLCVYFFLFFSFLSPMTTPCVSHKFVVLGSINLFVFIWWYWPYGIKCILSLICLVRNMTRSFSLCYDAKIVRPNTSVHKNKKILEYKNLSTKTTFKFLTFEI